MINILKNKIIYMFFFCGSTYFSEKVWLNKLFISDKLFVKAHHKRSAKFKNTLHQRAHHFILLPDQQKYVEMGLNPPSISFKPKN